jgi:rhomboid family GlyGly-CTERM serine protease
MAIRKTLGTWPVLIAAVACALLGAVAHAVNPFLEYRREALEGLQLWRLLTAHAAHLGVAHGALNGAALVLIWRIGRDTTSLREWAWLLLGAAAAVDAGLYWLSPDVEWYVGASGVLHGLLGGVAVLMLDRAARRFGAALLAAIVAKLAWEQVSGGAMTTAALSDAPVVTVAHLYGAIGGVAAAGVLCVVARRCHAPAADGDVRRNS